MKVGVQRDHNGAALPGECHDRAVFRLRKA